VNSLKFPPEVVLNNNNNRVPFEFRWEMYPGDHEELTEPLTPEQAPFTVSPVSGVFPEDGEVTFAVEFQPKNIGTYSRYSSFQRIRYNICSC
jgi:hypothetical protein